MVVNELVMSWNLDEIGIPVVILVEKIPHS